MRNFFMLRKDQLSMIPMSLNICLYMRINNVLSLFLLLSIACPNIFQKKIFYFKLFKAIHSKINIYNINNYVWPNFSKIFHSL